MSAPSTIAAALVSLLDTAPSWLPQVDHWEIAEDTDTWILSGQLAGDPREAEAFRLLAPVIERAPSAHSDDGRLVKVPFEWDGVSGQVWYLRPVERYVVPERCATCPTLLADAGNQFVRLGGRGAPVICVPCRDRMHEAWVREAAVRELGALPMPVGPESKPSDGFRVVVELANADNRSDADWAAELAENALEGQGFKVSATVAELAEPAGLVPEAALDVAVEELSAFLRVRLALESARRGRRELRTRVAELEAARQPAEGSSYPPALPWARHMDDEDLSDFLDELAAAAGTPGSYEGALATVENAIATWRLIGEAQHAHNTAPGPDAEEPPLKGGARLDQSAATAAEATHWRRLGIDAPQDGAQ